MDRTRIWHVAVIVVVVFLAAWFAIPPKQVVLERRLVTTVREGEKLVGAPEEKVLFRSRWAGLMGGNYTEEKLVSERVEEGRVVRTHLVEVGRRPRVALGLDLRGGSELGYRMAGAEGLTVSERQTAYDQTAGIVEKRINIYGLKEPRVQPGGRDRLIVQIPGVDRAEVERVKRLIETAGKLEFRLVSSDEALIARANAGDVPRGYHLYEEKRIEEGKEVTRPRLVSDTALLGGESIDQAAAKIGEGFKWEVALKFDRVGATLFERVTTNNTGELLAVVLNTERAGGEIVEKGVLYTAPEIQEPIPHGNAMITKPRGFLEEEAKDLATTLQSGSLPLGLELEWESFVGPGLGEDSIRSSTKAIIIGLALVLVFMAVYYLAVGLVANFAMCLDLLFIVGALGMFRATLTLPGIAGLILTVGMAVDANILIFERMREEKAKPGTSLATAVKNGYQRAFITILDANLTTLITALILFYVGTGPVRGFAVTLSVGIVASVFAAVFVTRVIVNVLVEKGVLRELRMLRLLTSPRIDFMRRRRWAFLGSAVFVVLGLVVFFARGEKNLGIDFTGGVLAEIALKEPMATSEVRGRVAETGLSGMEVQSVWTKEAKLESGGVKYSHFEVRAGTDVSEEELESGLREAFAAELQPEPFPVVKRVPVKLDVEEQDPFAGGTRVVMNLESPLGLEEIRAKLASIGYDDADVKAAEGAESEGAVLSKVEIKVHSTNMGDVRSRLKETFKVTSPIVRAEKISGMVAGELKGKAYMAIAFALIAIIVYIWFRFEFRFGVAAVIALAHDVAIAVGALAIVDALGLLSAKFNLPIVAALLTIIGYSLNDTIVVFDRVRENLASGRRMGYGEVVNLSVNQTLSRTILTSLTTFVVVFVLFLIGGRTNAALGGFAFALMVGILVGTYSSIFVASAVVVEWSRKREQARKRPARAKA